MLKFGINWLHVSMRLGAELCWPGTRKCGEVGKVGAKVHFYPSPLRALCPARRASIPPQAGAPLLLALQDLCPRPPMFVQHKGRFGPRV